MKLFRILLAGLLLPFAAIPQQNSFPFSIRLEEVVVENFNGLHSYAWARDGQRILLAGGRTDGLHRRQPFAAFRPEQNNSLLIVLDLAGQKIYSRPLSGLPTAIAEQLQSTNMQFLQEGNELFLTGGYGYSASSGDHITYPFLQMIRVRETINAIINGEDPVSFISQTRDERMAVTGGRMAMMDGRIHLVGGHRFDGRYNPHGPDHGPGFSQQYTNQVRSFGIDRKGAVPSVVNYDAVTDSLLLHRRDYNLLPYTDELGRKMLTIYSGVFQYDQNIPYTSLIDIGRDSVKEFAGFEQKFNHYHTATLTIFDVGQKQSFNIFFGGLSLHRLLPDGKIEKDEEVPFVDHISVLERSKGKASEYILPLRMPGLLGTSAEFIPVSGDLYTSNGMLKAESIGQKELLAGYIIGGIESTAPNVFFSQGNNLSKASAKIFKVFIASGK